MKKPVLFITLIYIVVLFSSCSKAAANGPNGSDTSVLSLEKATNTSIPSNDVNAPSSNTYIELKKLPSKYPSELARINGDVVGVHGKGFNVEKLDKFIESSKSGGSDMIRVTTYTTEGDAIIYDIVKSNGSLKLIADSTRDLYSSNDNRVIKEYKLTDIHLQKDNGNLIYSATLSNGRNMQLIYVGSN